MTFFLLLICFFLSGFSALLYETVWSREFAFVFGTSELAVVAVLAAYMGGLALGAALAARWAPRIRRPVLAYGVLELAIALWAIALPYAIRAVRAVYLGWLGGLDALPETLGIATHAFHLIGAFLVLVPCTALMGATLPLLARYAVTKDDQIGPRVGLLYGVNTSGAIAGTLAAAFILLPALGLRHTVYVGAAVNALIFLASAALARSTSVATRPAASQTGGISWILPVIAVSGAVSFGYEVLWFRMLGQVIGGSTAAFSTMLASFLAGIALGSAIAARWARNRAAALTGFAIAQLATAITARAGFAAADRVPVWAAQLGASVNALGPGALLAMAILLPLTLCVGATFPFAVRLLARDAADASASSGRVYAWNTVGSIAGAVGTGYVLLPWLGLEGALTTGVLLSLLLALATSLIAAPTQRLVAGIAVAGGLATLWMPAPRPDLLIRSSPLGNAHAGEFKHVAIGRSSTVALIDVGMSWRLTTNGLPESVITPDGYPSATSAADWLSILPVLARPATRHMVIIGLGGGMTVGAVPRSVDTVEVIELEPEVVVANLAARAGEEGDPLRDPRVSVRLSDARGALILADQRYDAIVSQPSHPWTSGASHLYTREFFELVRSRLVDDGVFVQWIGAPFVDPHRLRALIAALNDTFEHVAVFRIKGAAIVMLSSNAPFDIPASAAQAIAADREDYLSKGIFSPESVASALVLDTEASRVFSEGATPNTDDFNVLATSGIPSSGRERGWINEVFVPHDPLPDLVGELDLAILARVLQSGGEKERAERLARKLDTPQRELFRGWLAIEAQLPRVAAKSLRAALEADPTLQAAEIGLALVEDDYDTSRLPERVRAVVDARVDGERGPESWEAVRAIEEQAASWQPDEILYPEAAELRTRWRAALGGPAEFDEATAILSALIARKPLPRYLVLYARLAQLRNRPEIAWMALDSLGSTFARRSSPSSARKALALADELGEPPNPEIIRNLKRGTGTMRTPSARGMGPMRRPALR
jgi:spermidine synthase